MNVLFKYNCTPLITQKQRGSGLLIMAIVSAAIVGLTAVSLVKVNHLAFNGLNASQIALQAQQYADAEAAILKATAYTDLTAHNRVDIQNSNGYQSEIILSNESDYSDVIKQKTATIKIYRNGETNPRCTLNLLKLSVEQQQTSDIPVGTIIAWGGSNPSIVVDNATWLLCDGRSFSSSLYPKLAAALGTSNLPDLDGRFLEGNNAQPMRFKEAGLPNITGTFYHDSYAGGYKPTGAFYKWIGRGWQQLRGEGGNGGEVYFDASYSNPIYGKASTVQPASYTVRYYIKAA